MGCRLVENSLAVSHWHTFTIETSNSTLSRCLTKKYENMNPHRDVCLNVLCNFVIAKNKTASECPSDQEWISKLWYIHTIECYLAIKGNELLKLKKKKWTINACNNLQNFKGILLSEKRHATKDYKLYDFIYLNLFELIEKVKPVEIKSRSMVSKGQRCEKAFECKGI